MRVRVSSTLRVVTGAPIADLTSDGFSLIEDGTDAKIVSAQIGTTSMKVALLVDNEDRISDLREVLNPFRDSGSLLEGSRLNHLVNLFTVGA